MKNENNFFLINEIWTFVISFKNRRVLRDKWIYKIKRKKTRRDSALQNALSDSRIWTNRETWLQKNVYFDD
jgi:hypothetical protein